MTNCNFFVLDLPLLGSGDFVNCVSFYILPEPCINSGKSMPVDFTSSKRLEIFIRKSNSAAEDYLFVPLRVAIHMCRE